MSNSTLDSITKSIREAGKILRGEVVDFESWRVRARSTTRRKDQRSLGLFVGSDEDFISGKIYQVRPLKTGSVHAISETGESVILDESDFLLVKFQPKAEKLIREIVAS